MKRILVVEDDDAIRTGLCRSLSSDTLDTAGAGDLMSARRRLDTERYDLFLLDCNLPDGNFIPLHLTRSRYFGAVTLVLYSRACLEQL